MFNKIINLITLLLFCFTNNIFSDVPVDNYESYLSDSELQNIWQWTDVITGDQMTITLNASGGADSTQALQLDFSFSDGQVNPTGYTGGLVNNDNHENWSGNDSISVWLKATSTGDSLQYIQLAVHEGNFNVGFSSWGDKMRSAKVYISDLDSSGEYVSLAFSDFEDYGGFGGPHDNGILELDDIRSILIFSRYDGTASGGSSTVLVDDIIVSGGSSMVRYPYLQNVTQTSIKVLWGSWDSVGKLFYGSSPGVYIDSISSVAFQDNDNVYIHTAAIPNLTAGETIYYYVRDGESENIGFNDPTYYAVAAPNEDASFRLVVYSDSQGSPWWETQHSAVINAMIPHDPDIILNCGDISQNGQLYQFNDYYFANAAPIQKNTPIYTAIGNHDMLLEPAGDTYDIDIENYHELMDLPMNNSLEDGTEDYYSFDYGLVHFVCLNTQRVRNWGDIQPYYNVAYNDSMKAWLERDLQATTKPWKVVYFHIQAWNNSVYNKGWSTVFENYGVNLVFYGHGHAYYSNYRNDVTYIMTGGGGGKLHSIPWYAWPETRIGSFLDYHFTQVDVTPEKLYVNLYDKDNNLRHWIELGADGIVNYPQIVSIDDFEMYTTTDGLQGIWNLTTIPSEYDSLGVTLEHALASGGETGASNVMQLDFSFPAESADAWGAIGLSGQWNWALHNGINLWIKAVTTGDADQFYQIRILEANGGDKWVATKPLNELDENGQYVSVYFNDFEWYGAGNPDSSLADGLMDLDNISTFYVGTKSASTPATQNSTATLLVDDISAYLISVMSTHLDDNFEGYANNSALGAKWDMVWTSKNTVNMSRSLDVINGVNASQAMKLEMTVESETTPSTDPDLGVNWEPCIYGITGFFTASEHQTDMTGYQGVKVWLMPGANTGNEDFYFKLNLIEDEANGSEEKWMSPKVYLNTLNPNGEYIYFPFDEFYQYYTNSTESMELDKIKLSYLFLAYDNIVTLNSTASVMVDDITYINELAIDSGENIVPHRFNLYQNYPNPFNPTTTINYDLAYTSDAQLIVYDIVGREIIKLVDNKENAGTHNIKWNGRDKYGVEVASGVYIYQLKSGNNSMSRKLLLIK